MAFFFSLILALLAVCQADVKSQVAVTSRSPICKASEGYYKVESSCDAYIQCSGYVAKELLCPDGMYFNPAAKYPEYPCGYPMDVPCVGQTAAHTALSTTECPHQFGYYPPKVATDCGRYRMCADGRSYDMSCPTGLAFNTEIARCDWPENVPTCKSSNFLGFKCPNDDYLGGQPSDTIENYKYSGNCTYFYSCVQGEARLLSCDEGFAFDATLRRCVSADLVNTNCNN